MERQINQIALSVSNLAETMAWYGALGLESSGGSGGPRSGSERAKMLRLPEAEARMEWLVGRNPMTQLELFHFTKPSPRSWPPTRTARDEGYGSISLFVVAFEQQLDRLNSSARPFEITGAPGSRSLWVRDPDGIAVELMERDVLASEPIQADGAKLAGIRAVSLTVSDLRRVEDFWTSALGFSPVSADLYAFNPPPSWWSDGAEWEERVLKGGSILVRLLTPTSGNIINRPGDYRLSDIGVLNIAAICDSADAHQRFIEVLQASGFELSVPAPQSSGPQSAVLYGYDPLGNSVETGYLVPGLEGKFGWRR
jgi:catechol 2,3-dioxygenase-like lactoylglutathione lyase family enzyme